MGSRTLAKARGGSSILGHKPQDVDHVLDVLGVDGRVMGGELSGHCPLHNDRRPSFSINLESGLWFCHRGCGGGGGPLDKLVALVTGATRQQAKRWLRGVRLETRPDEDWDDWDDGVAWNEQYLDRFTDPPEFALEERGISSEAAADLGIRWEKDAGLHNRYGFKLNPRVNHWDGWILPMRHPDSHLLVGWQTKIPIALDNDTWTTRGTPKSRTLFGIDVFEPGHSVVLVESPLDVAVLRTFGVPALASFGASVSRAQRKLLADRASLIVLAMDNDDAGEQSRQKLLPAPEFAGKDLRSFNYGHVPKAKDVGEMEDEEIRVGLRTAKRPRR